MAINDSSIDLFVLNESWQINVLLAIPYMHHESSVAQKVFPRGAAIRELNNLQRAQHLQLESWAKDGVQPTAARSKDLAAAGTAFSTAIATR